MGDRRMFSLKIINTSKFLRLPSDTQNLYFHLGLRADDDGIVEAYPVMNTIKASEDSLKLLHTKDLIKVLNDDLITYITDWSEHNTIRADRKVDSIYKDLLVQILPDVKLKESKQRADRPEKIIEIGQPVDDIGTSQGQPMDGLSKDKLSKDKLSKVKLINSDDPTDVCPYEQIVTLFNSTTNVAKVSKITKSRQEKLKLRWKEIQNIDVFKEIFSKINESDFLQGKKTDWKVTFDWIIDNDKNYVKVLEGHYNNNNTQKNYNPIAGKNAKTPQLTNFDQREYKDEDFDIFYKNV